MVRDPITGRNTPNDHTGRVYGNITVLGKTEKKTKNNTHIWLVRCSCNAEFEVPSSSLRFIKLCYKCSSLKNLPKPTHNMTGSRTYRSWNSMHNRCRNPNSVDYEHYGGRGITVCEEWYKFEKFLEDMGERPPNRTLDRIDRDASYSRSNCQWATDTEQSRNRSCVKLTYEIAEEIRRRYSEEEATTHRSLAQEYEVNYATVQHVIKRKTWVKP